MASAKLFYFDGRGRAELIRMVLTACGVKYSETCMSSKEQFLELRPSLLFGQLPLLEIDNVKIVQTNAIVRHLARTHKLDGKDEKEKTLIDQYYEGSRDFLASFMGAGFMVALEKVAEHAKPALLNSDCNFKITYCKVLKENGSSGYLVGSTMTLADLSLLEVVLMAGDYYGEAAFDSYPELKKFKETQSKLNFYNDYFHNIRKPMNSHEYVTKVKEVLSMK
ncbi:hypothetical protein HELRODRAFT_168913 [Helobdella robusta]|uniref:Uncharacterized protein n=1 Tax=Helobdella robusta TaxID=6412 RepID=T1F145_HELRO|nr:hypothetical protein HELRODRAFT_168913 [Helobdella robusta]ESO08984.1 hypothetical protein HELRODRAFT_168913 [Helobdella robusta]